MAAGREVGSKAKLQEPLVRVVDDDAGIRSAVLRLLTIAKIDSESYESGRAFLDFARFERPGCIVLDVAMPGMNGLEVQAVLKQRHVALPIVFLTGTSEIPVAVTAMREGAVDFIEKPFENDDLVKRVRAAIEQNARVRQADVELALVRARVEHLTPREHEIMEHVVTGLTSKEIARRIGSSHRTIEIHRGRVMEKMEAATLADLVRMRLLLQGVDDRGASTPDQ